MDLVGTVISVMVGAIILYSVVLPANNSAIMTRNATPTETGWSNQTALQWSLTNQIQTLLVATFIIYIAYTAILNR